MLPDCKVLLLVGCEHGFTLDTLAY